MIPSLNSIMSRLHSRQLRLLIALEEQGSLLGAADKVGLTQPGASKALKELEATFGAELFTRTNRGLVPTVAGRSAARCARLIQADLEHLRFELNAIERGVGGRLLVGAIMGAVPVLMDAVSELIAVQPEMSVEVVEDTSESLLALVNSGRLDAALCRSSVSSTPQLYQSLYVKDESLAVIANVSHPRLGGEPLTLADLAESRWVVYRANMPMRRLLEREFHEAGLPFPVHLIETTSVLATLSLLHRNAAFVALVSVDVANYCMSHNMVGVLPLTLYSRSEPYELVFRKGAPKTPAIESLVRVLCPDAAD
ncbi:LysR family transcriptional regulator [Burkholderia pyrrocinia]|uniref:LysR family transcriptional regulator n=1 Tax=Burkholderia pyrrocinia TaxID=60550 RepID=UPI00050328F8|nr:LysR family transcriptional regulator [Burkholderia pyrrocinia]KFL50018.1 LysR family transcriptional regulator [Burkholderia pyrrocinia]